MLYAYPFLGSGRSAGKVMCSSDMSDTGETCVTVFLFRRSHTGNGNRHRRVLCWCIRFKSPWFLSPALRAPETAKRLCPVTATCWESMDAYVWSCGVVSQIWVWLNGAGCGNLTREVERERIDEAMEIRSKNKMKVSRRVESVASVARNSNNAVRTICSAATCEPGFIKVLLLELVIFALSSFWPDQVGHAGETDRRTSLVLINGYFRSKSASSQSDIIVSEATSLSRRHRLVRTRQSGGASRADKVSSQLYRATGNKMDSLTLVSESMTTHCPCLVQKPSSSIFISQSAVESVSECDRW